MDLYVLDNDYFYKQLIDEYISAIWTERFSDSGDMSLSVPDTADNRILLAEGTYLGVSDSSEVMIIETQEIKDSLLKVTGVTLDTILKSRVIIPADVLDQASMTSDMSFAPGFVMNGIVFNFATEDGWTLIYGATSPLGIDGAKQVIPNLVIGDQAPGTPEIVAVERGPIYDMIKKLGQTHNIGWRLIPTDLTVDGRTLEFSTWVGKDRTSFQTVNPMVRFSPNLDSLAGIKELRSHSGYRNVAYAISSDFDPETIVDGYPYTGVAYAYPGAASETGFARKVILVDITGITIEAVNDSIDDYKAIMNSHAKDALANNNFTRVVDGEVVPQSEYKYGIDYNLGDIVELQDQYGYIQKARITEYIRSKDINGSREYPTVSVIT